MQRGNKTDWQLVSISSSSSSFQKKAQKKSRTQEFSPKRNSQNEPKKRSQNEKTKNLSKDPHPHEAVIAAMQAHPLVERIQLEGCECLGRLAVEEDEAVHIIEAGGCSPMTP
eukprot:4092100-Amphidinium_carterae.1